MPRDPAEFDEGVARALGQIPAARSVAVAFSGGLDSTVLLHAALARGFEALRALHVNHNLGPDAGSFQRHCQKVAATLAVELKVLPVDVGPGNLESAARRARYSAWRDALGRDELLLLAHHADDQAETVLWQTFSGRAAIGMPSARALGSGRLVRPLLALRRADLADYARAHRLTWIDDPSNADQQLDRNYIRHTLLPSIEQRFPDAVGALANAARERQRAQAPREAALRSWLGVGVGQRLLAELGKQAAARADAQPLLQLPDGRAVRRYRGRLFLVDPGACTDPFDSDGATVRAGAAAKLGAGVLTWRPAPLGLRDGDTLRVSVRRGGERLTPAGRGVQKRLKTLFQEAGVPPWRRAGWPLLYDGDRLVAVPNVAVAAEAAVEGGRWPVWQYEESTSFELD